MDVPPPVNSPPLSPPAPMNLPARKKSPALAINPQLLERSPTPNNNAYGLVTESPSPPPPSLHHALESPPHTLGPSVSAFLSSTHTIITDNIDGARDDTESVNITTVTNEQTPKSQRRTQQDSITFTSPPPPYTPTSSMTAPKVDTPPSASMRDPYDMQPLHAITVTLQTLLSLIHRIMEPPSPFARYSGMCTAIELNLANLLESLSVPITVTDGMLRVVHELAEAISGVTAFLSPFATVNNNEEFHSAAIKSSHRTNVSERLSALLHTLHLHTHSVHLQLLDDLPDHIQQIAERNRMKLEEEQLQQAEEERAAKAAQDERSRTQHTTQTHIPQHTLYSYDQPQLSLTYDHTLRNKLYRSLKLNFVSLNTSQPRIILLEGNRGSGVSSYAQYIWLHLLDASYFRCHIKLYRGIQRNDTLISLNDRLILKKQQEITETSSISCMHHLRYDTETCMQQCLLPIQLHAFDKIHSDQLNQTQIQTSYYQHVWNKRGVIWLEDMTIHDAQAMMNLLPDTGQCVLIVSTSQRAVVQSIQLDRTNCMTQLVTSLDDDDGTKSRVSRSSNGGSGGAGGSVTSTSGHPAMMNLLNSWWSTHLSQTSSSSSSSHRTSNSIKSHPSLLPSLSQTLNNNQLLSLVQLCHHSLTALTIIFKVLLLGQSVENIVTKVTSIPLPSLYTHHYAYVDRIIQYVYEQLLTTESQLLLRQLHVFAGTFDVSALCDILDVKADTVRNMMQTLVNHGLVTSQRVSSGVLYSEHDSMHYATMTPSQSPLVDALSHTRYELPSRVYVFACERSIKQHDSQWHRRLQLRFIEHYTQRLNRWQALWTQLYDNNDAAAMATIRSTNSKVQLDAPAKSPLRLSSPPASASGALKSPNQLPLPAAPIQDRRYSMYLKEEKEEKQKSLVAGSRGSDVFVLKGHVAGLDQLTEGIPAEWDPEEKVSNAGDKFLRTNKNAHKRNQIINTTTAAVPENEREADDDTQQASPEASPSSHDRSLSFTLTADSLHALLSAAKSELNLPDLSRASQLTALLRHIDTDWHNIIHAIQYAYSCSQSNTSALSLLSYHSLYSYRLSPAIQIQMYYRLLELSKPRGSILWLKGLSALAKSYTANHSLRKALQCYDEYVKRCNNHGDIVGKSHGLLGMMRCEWNHVCMLRRALIESRQSRQIQWTRQQAELSRMSAAGMNVSDELNELNNERQSAVQNDHTEDDHVTQQILAANEKLIDSYQSLLTLIEQALTEHSSVTSSASSTMSSSTAMTMSIPASSSPSASTFTTETLNELHDLLLRTLYHLGICYTRQKSYDAAIRSYERGVDLAGDDVVHKQYVAMARASMADVYVRLHQHDDAIVMFRQARDHLTSIIVSELHRREREQNRRETRVRSRLSSMDFDNGGNSVGKEEDMYAHLHVLPLNRFIASLCGGDDGVDIIWLGRCYYGLALCYERIGVHYKSHVYRSALVALFERADTLDVGEMFNVGGGMSTGDDN